MHDNPRQTLHIWPYIAGLIDGEGSFMITKSNDKIGKGRRSPTFCPRIRCSMTTRECLDFIVKNTGYGKVNYEGARPSRPTRKGIYKWEITGIKQVKEFIDCLLPYLQLKIPKAKHLHTYCLNFNKKIKCMDGVDKVELATREEAYWKMRKLNGSQVAATTKPSNIRENEAIVCT